jgi:hypothetical protein
MELKMRYPPPLKPDTAFFRPLSAPHEEAVSGPAHEGDGPSGAPSASPEPPARRVYSLSEVARVFGRTTRTLRWWAATGRIRTIQIGQKRFVADTELQRLLSGGASSDVAHDHEPSQ